MNLVTPVTTTGMGMTMLLIYCYLGKVATESFAKMSDCVYNMKWYELPVNLQKYVILMIMYMQKPLYYHGHGVIYVNLETFTKVNNNVKFSKKETFQNLNTIFLSFSLQLLKSAVTYYMAIKAVTHK